MTDENRQRLTALVAAGAKLDTAAFLAREAALDIASSGLLPHEDVKKVAAEIDALVARIVILIARIP